MRPAAAPVGVPVAPAAPEVELAPLPTGVAPTAAAGVAVTVLYGLLAALTSNCCDWA